MEFVPVYFNSTTKRVINSEYDIDKSFQEILYKIDNWINDGSGLAIEFILFLVHYQKAHILNCFVN